MGLFDSPPTDRLRKPRKSPSSLIWLIWHISCGLALSVQEGHAGGIDKAAQKWIWPDCPHGVWHLHWHSTSPNLCLSEIERHLGSFPPQHAPWRWRKVSNSFPFPSSFLAQGALANPIYLFIPHSWWCSLSTNSCHGEWVVVEDHRDPEPCRHWWTVQVRRVKEQCSPYLKIPQSTLPRMKIPTGVSCCRCVFIYVMDIYASVFFRTLAISPFLEQGKKTIP